MSYFNQNNNKRVLEINPDLETDTEEEYESEVK